MQVKLERNMLREEITMSQKEVTRLKIVTLLEAGKIKQLEAGKILTISSRQVRRLLSRYKRYGAKGLISKRLGKPSSNRLPDNLRQDILSLIKAKYVDFGPTFLQEKLSENHGITVSRETLRQIMITNGFWNTKRRKQARIHQCRERRSCFGELVQIDGSPHDWFEGRREPCSLLVFIDDATGKILQLHFEENETTKGYFYATRSYIKRYGLPVAFYSDRHSIFRVNMPETSHEAETQFERAMKTLEIELINANSPQAKGRVERANETLQDRLVKELRLLGISDIETANAYLPKFIEKHNARFAVVPKSEINAHRKLQKSDEELDLIFCLQHERKLSKNLELSYKNIVYQVQVEGHGYTLRRAKVTVCEDLQGNITLLYKGRKLKYRCYKKQKRQMAVVYAKALNSIVNNLVKKLYKPNKPKMNHPWRQYKNQASLPTLVSAATAG
jgi:transposase